MNYNIMECNGNRLLHGDARLVESYIDVMKGVRADLILADPPYCLLTRRNKKTNQLRDPKKAKINHSAVTRFDKVRDFKNFSQEWMSHAFSYLSENGTIIIWNNFLGIAPLKEIAKELGYHCFEREFLWGKLSQEGVSNERIARIYEVALVFTKKKPFAILNHEQAPVMSYIGNYDDNKEATKWGDHPNHKPHNLLEILIRQYSKPGDVILDPFSGSGSTLASSIFLNRKICAIELKKEWFDMSSKRMTEIIKEK